jgi:hypothetical protein
MLSGWREQLRISFAAHSDLDCLELLPAVVNGSSYERCSKAGGFFAIHAYSITE